MARIDCNAVTFFAGLLASLTSLSSTLAADQRRGPADINSMPILFVVRQQYASDHHNTATLFQTGEINAHKFQPGSALKVLVSLNPPVAKTLLSAPDGVIRDPDVSFDGRRILFSMRRTADDDYHLYEIQADGQGLKQLTFGAGISDIDPIYLPDGRILFGSTREPKYCMCNRHIMCNLFTMKADGSQIEQIGHSTLFEGHPSLLPDGRVLYDRWEYVDRNFGDAQGAWTCRPDGTNHAVFWGNNTNSPGAVLDNRAVPGTNLFICTFSSCHDRPWGALALVDPARGLDGPSPVMRTWPASAAQLIGVGNYDTFKKVTPRYEDPFPLSDREFLCVRTVGKKEQTGLFLINLAGEETLLHTEAPGCFDPMPLLPRVRPPVLPSRIDRDRPVGYFYVADVYRGWGMESVARGTVKYLRVIESPEKRFWTQTSWNGGTGTQAPAMAWNDFANKRILGTAEVEDDGSAYFAVPANRFVYFQLLDAQKMMVQSMRSGTMVRPGETIGCAGCHQPRHESVPPDRPYHALRRRAQSLQPWYGPTRNFNYLAEVQPVFDRACVVCHDYQQPAGKKLNLCGDLDLVFNVSYTELRTKPWLKVPGAGPHKILAPRSWGSHASRLVDVLRRGHGDPQIDRQVHLSQQDFERIVTWIDLNAPYYPEYASGYRNNKYGRSPLTDQELKQLKQLTGSTEVNLTRPTLSPCLAKLRDPTDSTYRRALAIIETGSRRLASRPRADMPEFRLTSALEVQQQAKYESLTGRAADHAARNSRD